MSSRVSLFRSGRKVSSKEQNDSLGSSVLRRNNDERSRGNDLPRGNPRGPPGSDLHGRADLNKSGGNDGPVLNFSYDDPKLSSLVNRIRREDNVRRRNAAVVEFRKYLAEPASTRAIIRSADTLLSLLERILYEEVSHEVKDNVVQCLGTVGYMMGQEAKRFVQWALLKVNTSSSEDVKVLFMSALAKAVELDVSRLFFVDFIPFLMSNMHMLIENVETAEFLIPLVNVLSDVAKNYPQYFGPHFKDVVDILIGWHIDTTQSETLAPFLSDSLVAMHRFWVSDLGFSVNLISQFLEDVESYSRELATTAGDGAEMPSPEQCQSKVTALLGVLSTVVKAIGDGFLLPNVGTAVSEQYIADIVQRVIQSTELSNSSYFDEDVYIAANDCLSSLAGSLKSYFAVHCLAIVSFVNKQFVESPLTCIAHMMSVISFIKQIVKSVGNSLPPTFIQTILQSASPFLAMRKSHSEQVLQGVMDCLQGLLVLGSKPIQAATYEAVVSDLSMAVGVIQTGLKATVTSPDRGHGTGTMAATVSLSEAEGLVVFDLHVLHTVIRNSSAQKSSTPSVQPSSYLLNVLTQEWCSDFQLAAHCPLVHYSLVYILLELCENQGGLVHLGHQEVKNVMNVITSLACNCVLVLDTKLLTLKWLTQSLEAVSQQRQSSTESSDGYDGYDHLAVALLSSAFDREREVRVETAHCLRKLLQCHLVSEVTQRKCLQECVLKLTDTDGNVRGAFVAVLEALSPATMIGYCQSGWQAVAELLHYSGGPIVAESFVHKSLLARKAHCSHQPAGSFQAHHFQVIMNFLLKAVTPSRHVNDDWLERLYHSCQHCGRTKKKETLLDVSSGLKFNEQHFTNSVDGCDALLWFWSLWEPAQFVVLSKIRTPLGGPQETFQAIGNAVRSYYMELKEGTEQSQVTSTAVGKGTGVGPKYFTRNLRVNLLVMFMDHLEKHIYNADCGCAVALQPLPKNIRSFFRTNSSTCSDWLNRLRLPLATVALHCGSPAAAVKHCFEKLALTTPQDPEFEQLLVVLASAFCRLRASEALAGVCAWAREKCGRSLAWLDSTISVARGWYEHASKGLRKYWDKQLETHSTPKLNDTIKTASPTITNYVANQVLDCYTKLSDWTEVNEWIEECERHQEDAIGQQGLEFQQDINYIRALQQFDDLNTREAQEFLDRAAGADSANSRRYGHTWEKSDYDLGCRPLWDPWQMLYASQRQLLRALVALNGSRRPGRVSSGGDEDSNVFDESDGSDGEDEISSIASSVEGDTKTLNKVRRLLRQASAYSEVYLRVSALAWPPLVSAQHAAQLQCSAAVQNAVQETKESAAVRSPKASLLPFPQKCFTPSQHDAGLADHLLRVAAFLNRHGFNVSTQTVHNVALSSARLARKQTNFKLARCLLLSRMLDVHGFEVTHQPLSDEADDEDIAEVLSTITLSEDEDLLPVFQIQYEGAKLLSALGHHKQAAEILCYAASSVYELKAHLCDPLSEPFARLLVALAKWLQTDLQLAASVLSPDSSVYMSLTSLVATKRSWHFDVNNCNLHVNSGLSDIDSLPGLLLSLATDTSPGLAKAWANYASWCYRWGRRTVEQLSSMGTVELLPDEKSNALHFLPDEATSEEIKAVLHILGQAHFKNLVHQEELTGTDQLRLQFAGSSAIGGADSIRQQMLQSCPSLSSGPAARVDHLLKVWRDVCSRLFSHYRMAAKAYFTYLHLSGEAGKRDVGSSSHSLGELNVIATLRLLRLLVKHAQELSEELAEGFGKTPTEPWKAILPQLLSRLSHPDVNVRDSVTELVRRIALDCPYLVIYPAVVSCPLPAADSKQQQGNENLLKSISRMDSLTATGYGGEEQHAPAGGMEDFMGIEILDNLPMAKAAAAEASSNTAGAEGEQEEEEEEDEVTKEKQEELTALQGCFKVILESVSGHSPQLVVDVQRFVQELKRIRLLWEELWLGALAHRQPDVSRRLQQLEAEVKRVQDNATLGQDEKMKIMQDKHSAIMRPVLVALERICEFTSQTPETPHEEWFQKTYSKMLEKAFDALKHPSDPRKPRQCWTPFKEFHQSLYQRSQKRSSMSLTLTDISPKLAQTKSSFICLPGVTSSSSDHQSVSIESFINDVLILPTKTRPKKFTVRGYDGHQHSYLFKGLEDMHLDERIMQFLGIINTMFAKAERCDDPHFKARHYAVTPLGNRSGLVKWVDGATPLFAIYKRWQQREVMMQPTRTSNSSALSGLLTLPTLNSGHPQQNEVNAVPQRPSEQFFGKLKPLLSEKGVSADMNSRKQWPLPVMRQVLDELLAETPSDLLAKELWCASTGPSEWWGMTQTYARSTAVMSIVGYIIGLGDRHLDNLMIDLATGEIVHIDYNVCFEKGRILRVPEKVPFRLTENIKTALGLTGVEGTFRLSCEQILKTLRRGRETLLTLLEAFVYDPLVDWTTGNEEIFTAEQADVVEGVKAKAKLSDKREMERGITQALLSSRVAEMRVAWKKNKTDVTAEFQKLVDCIDGILSLRNLQRENVRHIAGLDEQKKLLQEVTATGNNHPVFHAQARYDAHQRLSHEQEEALRMAREKKADSERWQAKHEDTLGRIYSGELASLQNELSHPICVEESGCKAAAEFLTKTGQGHLIAQCTQAHSELLQELHKRRDAITTCLTSLESYERVISHYPAARFVAKNRSTEWQQHLDSILQRLSSSNCSRVLKTYLDSYPVNGDLHCSPAVRAKLLAVHRDLHLSLVDENAKLVKLAQRRPPDSDAIPALEQAVASSTAALQQRLLNVPHARASLRSIVTSALATLNTRWLVMEKTAMDAGGRLHELRSRDGDWFLDELLTMSMNVTQMVELLQVTPLNDAGVEKTIAEAFQAVVATTPVYEALQELVHKVQSSVAPQLIEALLAEEPGLEDVVQCLENADKAMTDHQAHRELSTGFGSGLDQADLLTDLAHESYVELLQSLSGVYAQVLNMLDQLFGAVEYALADLYECVHQQSGIPPQYIDIPLVKEATALSARRSGGIFLHNFTTESLFPLKLQCVTSFFKKSQQYVSCFKSATQPGTAEDLVPWLQFSAGIGAAAGAGSPLGSPTLQLPNRRLSIEFLLLPLRQFVSGCILQHLVGLPSESLASGLLHYLPSLGANVDDIFSKLRQSVGPDGVATKQLTLEVLSQKSMEWSMHAGNMTRQSLNVVGRAIRDLDGAWRKMDIAKRLENNVELTQTNVRHLQIHLAQFQWLYEDVVVATKAHQVVGMIHPARNNVMSELRKQCSGLQQSDTAVVTAHDKLRNTENTVIQRLRWAAASNPALATVIKEIEPSQVARNISLQALSDVSSDIGSMAETVLHFEAHRTRTPESCNADRTLVSLIERLQKSTKALEEHAQTLEDATRLLRTIEPSVGSLPRPLTMSWIHSRLQDLSREKMAAESKIQEAKGEVKKIVLSFPDHCRRLLAAWKIQSGLVQDVWTMLESMAEYERESEMSESGVSVSCYMRQQTDVADDLKEFTDHLKAVAQSDGAGSASDRHAAIRDVAAGLRVKAEWLHDQLLALTGQAEGGSEIANQLVLPPRVSTKLEKVALVREPSITIMVRGANAKETTETEQLTRREPTVARPPRGRDPRTGKALQERNTYAVNVWRRVKAKLEGRDVDPNKRMSVAEQVDFVIQEATNKDNLCVMYEGWTAWV